MKRISSLVAAIVVAAGVVLAETDYVALPIIKDIQQGADNGNRIETLKVGGNATVGGTLTAAGLVNSGTLQSSGLLTAAGITNNGTLKQAGIATFSATQTVFTAAWAAASTNPAIGAIQLRVNGTNVVVNFALPNS